MNVYFDNAATSFPKPAHVSKAMVHYLEHDGAPYGRSFYQSAFTVSSTIETCRDTLAELLAISVPERLTFTQNATTAINTVLKGFPYRFKRILVSPLEHNAVMRVGQFLAEKSGIEYEILPAFSDGLIDLHTLQSERTSILRKTDLVVVSHMSNVNGVIQPIKALKQVIGDIPLLVDAAQSAGHVEINVDDWNIDFLAITGHKSLLGPTGTGALYCGEKFFIEPLIHGGTGSHSESFSMPDDYPDRYEAGTPNVVGLYGLLAAIENKPLALHTRTHFLALLDRVLAINGIVVHKANHIEDQGELFSITHNRLSASDFAMSLYEKYGIQTRVGLHCAPLAHQHLKTSPQGTVRFALSPYHSEEDLEHLYLAIKALAKEAEVNE